MKNRFSGQGVLDQGAGPTAGVVQSSAEEVGRLPLTVWNDTAADYPRDKCIHQLFEAQAQQRPDAIAVTFEGRQLTYGELNCTANQVAHHLIQVGVGPETLVGLCMERSLEMLVGLLGILKAGGAYVPLDPSYPAERIAFILEDAQIQLLVTDMKHGAKYSDSVQDTLLIDGAQAQLAGYSQANPQSSVSAQNLAYTIYTSGSTGRPKGVSVQHQSVVNFLCSMARTPGLTADDTLLAVTTISFDIAGLELYLPLTQGAQIILASSQVATDGQQLQRLLETAKPTIMQATPATWRLLLLYGWPGVPNLKILCGGEALHAELAEKLLPRCASLWNMYGPTETTIWSTVYQVTPDQLNDSTQSQNGVVPIGRPIANTTIHILDANGQPTTVGVPGDLYIGGAGLARGYFNRPELTAERFIADPFAPNLIAGDPHARLYKTGDLAQYRADGTIDFLGRQDDQVKLRGFRIELGEIESVLNRHPGVEQAVVALKEDSAVESDAAEDQTAGGAANKRLVAYIKPNQQTVLPIPPWQLHALPNGLPLSVINKMEADHLYELIFDDLVYMKHGIQFREDACILDIGANIGISMLFLHQHAPKGKIYAFEPVPDIFDVLQTNAELYEQIDVLPLMIGLSSKPGSVQFTYYPHWSALSGLYGDVHDEEELSRVFMHNHYGDLATYAEDWLQGRFDGKTVDCELRTISQVIQEYQIEQIDLVKINVEKSEYDILLGIAEDDWAKIDQLVVEVHKGEGRMTNIENLLRKHGYEIAIEQTAALKDTVLHMIYAWKPQAQTGKHTQEPTAIRMTRQPLPMDELYDLMQRYLPDYMVPSAFVFLPQVPLTPNGKVDRKALPALDVGNTWVRSTTEFVAPEEEAEKVIADVWQSVLQLPQVGMLDRFFELGGNSLLAAQVHLRLTQVLPAFTMSLIEMFQFPTIRSLSDHLKRGGGNGTANGRNGAQQTGQDTGQQRAAKRKERAQQRRKERA
ncbi:MAG: amino acid adenylation domain-containing protein [Caldilineaceae bacterium]